LSLWIAVPFTILLTGEWREGLLLWPALSAGAILIEKVTQRNEDEPARNEEERTCAVAEKE
jgi:hypothetical protein